MSEKDRLRGKCPSCGAAYPRGSRVCEYCGTWLPEDTPAPDAPSSNVPSRPPAEKLPDWDSATLFPEEPEPAAVPAEKAAPQPAPAPPAKPEKPGFLRKLKAWRVFFPAWLAFCLILAVFPSPSYGGFYITIAFLFTFIPGLILYAIWHARSFRPPHWLAWLAEMVLITFSLVFFIFAKNENIDPAIPAMVLFFGPLLGIIWRIIYGARH